MALNSILTGASHDRVAQIAATPLTSLVPDSTPVYAATLTVNPLATFCVKVAANALGNCTINALNGGAFPQLFSVMIEPDASGTRTITFGTHFRSTGTVAPAGGKAKIVLFQSDGTDLVEISRTSSDV